MAVGLKEISMLHPVDGVKIGTAKAGIKANHKDDTTLFEFCNDAVVASVFTKNQFCAAPVIVAKKNLTLAKPRYLLVNTGNANAGTGKAGEQVSLDCCRAVATHVQCDSEQVLPFSTGVIGEPLDAQLIINALPSAVKTLSENNWVSAANAIMTTDTMPKGISKKVNIGKKTITITGISKGSGMIRPDMATMLAYIATDAEIESKLLQSFLNRANRVSFNAITIDGDTSTNDACLLIATGKSKVKIQDTSSSDLFYHALEEILQYLAQSIIRDGEGATKFITVHIKNANDMAECEKVAYTVAHSPLVKTAFFASDPNWGRILAAVGRAGIDDLDVDKITIKLNELTVVKNGGLAINYSESSGQAVMDLPEICITVDLNRGETEHKIWTTDLSYEYIKINAEYRT